MKDDLKEALAECKMYLDLTREASEKGQTLFADQYAHFLGEALVKLKAETHKAVMAVPCE